MNLQKLSAISFAVVVGMVPFQNCTPSSRDPMTEVGSKTELGNVEISESTPEETVPTENQSTLVNTVQEVVPNPGAASAKNPSLPKIIVNHDFWAHTYWGLESGGSKKLPYVDDLTDTQAVADAIEAITGNQSELSKLGAGFSMNATYGSHNLWYWGSADRTYAQWLRGLLGPANTELFLGSGGGGVDTLILNKILGKSDLIQEILAKKTTSRPFIISVRMNDHHHLNDADQFLANLRKPPVENPRTYIRRLAALSPDYKDFLAKGSVLSGVEKPKRGKTGDGLGCDRPNPDGEFSYHLDYSDIEVLKHKSRELADLFAKYDELDGVELDFLRANCYFPRGTKAARKKELMNYLLGKVFDAKNAFVKRTGKNPTLTLRVPLDESPLETHGIDVKQLAQNKLVDGIIFGYSQPYLRSQVVPNTLKGHSDLKIYFELYQITDNQRSRRQATRDEIATAGYEALNAGYDGLSLFNFHYIFDQANPHLKPEFEDRAFAWAPMLSLLNDKNKIKTTIAPTYFFCEKNADGDFTVERKGDPVSIVFRHASQGRATEDTAVLRIIGEGFLPANAKAWNSVKFNVKVNGVLVKTNAGAAVIPTFTGTYGRDPIAVFKNDYVKDWGPATSKEIRIPKKLFRDYTNRIEVVPVTDPDGLFNQRRRLELQLTM